MKQLVFVSSNKGKIEEAQTILGRDMETAHLELVEIQDFDVEVVVRHKAQSAFEKIQKPLLVDDSGLYIEAWNGFPGPFIKYIMERGGNPLLLKMLEGTTNRNAYCVSAIGYHDGHEVHVFLGKKTGTLTESVRGTVHANGYNSIFIPEGSKKTYSEMTMEEKSTLSHRNDALQLLKKYLDEH